MQQTPLSQGFPSNPVALAKSLGLEVHYSSLSNLDGVLLCVERAWCILVNCRRHKARRRFTIAHEIGHYLLHRDLQPCFLCRPQAGGALEREANQFAADLLMPAEACEEWIASLRPSKEAAEHFGVSVAAWESRVRQLCETSDLGDRVREVLEELEQTRAARAEARVQAVGSMPVDEPRIHWVKRGKRWRKLLVYGGVQGSVKEQRLRGEPWLAP